MKVLEAAGAMLLCAALNLSLGAAGRAGLLLRIRRQYLHEELAKRLTGLGENVTCLVEAHKKQRHPRAGRTPLRHAFGDSRMTVEMPQLPDAEITVRSSNSLDLRFKVLFGVYLEQPFDALSKEVQIQLRKDFSVLLSGSRNGFSIQGCSSCPDSLDIKTLYKASNTLVDDATPLARMALSKDLVPVLDAQACNLLESALSGPVSSLLSPGIFDLSPPGILYTVKSLRVTGDNLVLELRVSDGGGGAGAGGGGEEEGNAGLSEPLPPMHEEAAADIAVMETQMDGSFGPLLCPFEPIVVDKNHSLELEYLLVNLTIGGPARFALESYGAYWNQPLKIEVSNIKKPSNSTWTFTDVYSVPVDVSLEGNKLKISMSPDRAFLHMDEENVQARDLVTVLEKVLDAEIPPTWLDSVKKELPLPIAPGTGETVRLEVDTQEHVMLIAVIPALEASQEPAGE